MGATITLWNGIGEAEHVFLIAVVPLQSDFHRGAIPLGGKMDDGVMNRGLVAVQMLHESANSAFIFKDFLAILALVDEFYTHA